MGEFLLAARQLDLHLLDVGLLLAELLPRVAQLRVQLALAALKLLARLLLLDEALLQVGDGTLVLGCVPDTRSEFWAKKMSAVFYP